MAALHVGTELINFFGSDCLTCWDQCWMKG